MTRADLASDSPHWPGAHLRLGLRARARPCGPPWFVGDSRWVDEIAELRIGRSGRARPRRQWAEWPTRDRWRPSGRATSGSAYGGLWATPVDNTTRERAIRGIAARETG